MYETHADMLRSVIAAGENPLFEDLQGRNGLHYLAEVSLALSSTRLAATPEDSSQVLYFRRKRYSEHLLASGVNPNSYDRHGFTPLMAFIIHTRDEESDNQTTKLLWRLVKAGAHVNSRNRQGETALHLAVNLGRRNVTGFLISSGANVNARANCRFGVLALGLVGT